MTKKTYFLMVLMVIVGTFAVKKNQIASYLLTRELSSDKKVEEILTLKDEPISASSEMVFNNVSYGQFTPDRFIASLPKKDSTDKVLGISDERWIEINLSQQRLYAWEGNRLIYDYLVSTGKWAPTPTGTYRVWIKLASTTMKGGSKALGTYYYLPNVPCTMYFFRGYGIHGAYWHNNFGQPMSHGCVNMRPSESCVLFNWSSVGTRVYIHY